MLDLLEQLEAEFAPALALATEAAEQEVARMNSRALSAGAASRGRGRSFDEQEEDRAKVSLAAFVTTPLATIHSTRCIIFITMIVPRSSAHRSRSR